MSLNRNHDYDGEDSKDATAKVTSRLRGYTTSLLDKSVQPGMWAATGNALAHAPNLEQLRNKSDDMVTIAFTSQGLSAVSIKPQQVDSAPGAASYWNTQDFARQAETEASDRNTYNEGSAAMRHRGSTLSIIPLEEQHTRGQTFLRSLQAF